MPNNEIRIHRLAKIKKLDPLVVDFDAHGKLRMVRWNAQRNWYAGPNATAMEDLPAGGVAVAEPLPRKEGHHVCWEVRRKR